VYSYRALFGVVTCLLAAGAGLTRAEAQAPSPWERLETRHDGSHEVLGAIAADDPLWRCAMGEAEHGDPRDCVRVLTILSGDRLFVHRSLRAILRSSTSVAAAAEAAAALAALADLDSADLHLWALLSGRGGEEAVPSLIAAFVTPEPPWFRHYLRYVAARGPSPRARALAAGEALERANLKGASLPGLVANVRGYLADRPHPMDRRHLERVLAHVADRCGSEPATLRRCRLPALTAPRAIGLRETCYGRKTVDIAKRAEVREAARHCAGLSDSPRFYARTALARRFAPPQRAYAEAASRPGDDLGTRALLPPPLPAMETRDAPPDAFDPSALPPDFWGFDPRLPPPPWYPRHVHLTVDDGPRPKTLGPTLDVLERHGVKATFFFVGAAMVRRWLEEPEITAEVIRRTVAGGHRVGYHSMNHDTLPELHESGREADQVGDSASLFRWLLRDISGQPIPVLYGRFPGGRGAFHARMPSLYAEAGLLQHVFWNFGPGYWVQDTSVWEVARMACGMVRSSGPMTILLHEFPMLPRHLDALFRAMQSDCPADAEAAPRLDTRTVWRKDHVFKPILCSSDHPDAERMCERLADEERVDYTRRERRSRDGRRRVAIP